MRHCEVRLFHTLVNTAKEHRVNMDFNWLDLG